MKYILLTTPDEYNRISYFVQMQLETSRLFDAIGEIVNIPGAELVSPLYFKVDPRAPQLRFIEESDLEPPSQQHLAPRPPQPNLGEQARLQAAFEKQIQASKPPDEPMPKMYLVQEIKLEDINPKTNI